MTGLRGIWFKWRIRQMLKLTPEERIDRVARIAARRARRRRLLRLPPIQPRPS